MPSPNTLQDEIDVFNRNLSRILDTNRRILDFNITAARYSYSLINRANQVSLLANRPTRTHTERNNTPHHTHMRFRRRDQTRPTSAHSSEQQTAAQRVREEQRQETNEPPRTTRVRSRSPPPTTEEETPPTRRRVEVNIEEATLNQGNFEGNPLELFLNFARMLNERNNTDEAVENGMSPAQIREATTSGVYSELRDDTESSHDNEPQESQEPQEMEESQEGEEGDRARRPRCPISWSVFEEDTRVLKINGCGHIFSENALTEWLRLHSTCPTCRYNLVSSNEQFRQRNEGSSEPRPMGLNVPEMAPMGVDINSDLNALGFFANMLRGSPIDRSDIENLAGLGDTFNINITNSNID